MRWWRLNNVPPSVHGSGPRWHQKTKHKKQRNPHERWHQTLSNLGLLPNSSKFYLLNLAFTLRSIATCHLPKTYALHLHCNPQYCVRIELQKKMWDAVWCCKWFQGNQTLNSLKEQLETFRVAAAVYMMTDKIVDCRSTLLSLTHDRKYFLTVFCTQPNPFGLDFAAYGPFFFKIGFFADFCTAWC